jgi:hypothetical protein
MKCVNAKRNGRPRVESVLGRKSKERNQMRVKGREEKLGRLKQTDEDKEEAT